jgi:hypothetical protein
MCEDDYECNGGKANFPLRCLDVAVAKMCVDPDDFLRPSSTEAAYEPPGGAAGLPRRPQASEAAVTRRFGTDGGQG